MKVSGEEKFVMRAAFEAGFGVEQTAAMVGRSPWTVNRYFALYRGKLWKRRGRPLRKISSSPRPLSDPVQFYVSEFEPT